MIDTDISGKKFETNHHFYEFVIAISTTEGILTMREKIYHHDSLVDTVASSDQSFHRAVREITELYDSYVLNDEEMDQYSIIALNGDLHWAYRLELPCRS